MAALNDPAPDTGRWADKSASHTRPTLCFYNGEKQKARSDKQLKYVPVCGAVQRHSDESAFQAHATESRNAWMLTHAWALSSREGDLSGTVPGLKANVVSQRRPLLSGSPGLSSELHRDMRTDSYTAHAAASQSALRTGEDCECANTLFT